MLFKLCIQNQHQQRKRSSHVCLSVSLMQLRTHVFYNLKMIQNLFGFGQKSIVIGRFHDPIMTPYRIKKVKIPVNTYITFSAQDSTINI